LLVWLTGAVVTRYSSVGGMMAALASAVLFTVARTTVPLDATWPLAAWAMTALLLFKHGDNIARLRAGTESKIGAKEPSVVAPSPLSHNGGPALDAEDRTR
jgi:glycerol-3-phosphate acyltransferase PlsY